jgi:hypothetical protein
MHRKRRAIKALGLSLMAALSLMAITATAAQAGEFKVKGNSFASQSIKSESVEGQVALSEFSVWGLGIQIHCPVGDLSGTIFQGGTVKLEVLFLECQVAGNKNCTIYEQEEENPGKIRTAGEGELIFHNGNHYVKFESEAFNIVYIKGAKCTLPEEMVAQGSAALEVSTALSELVNQSFSNIDYETEELLGVSLFCSAEPSTVLGTEGTISLSGTREGQAWGVQ